ncbi:hypothetical protein [Aquibacillus salsiterrae]|uniref:Uncharacterized protein n=1 Tax=Aquibacillus salsiterrae TaxID=2950439 RepID=A0A9X4AG97_9BACI|nr:hypothetical protein [Aquibacillus salsiterrae]MDC3418721.1 hypothetical protein [Aquibacillus salsiterrae]
MYMIKWISVKEIKVIHEYLPPKDKAVDIYTINKYTNGPLMGVYQNSSNQFLLHKGIDTYNALKVLNPNKKVPCFIFSFDISELDWCFSLLRTCFSENVYFRIRYDYIMNALKATNYDVERIADEVGCSHKEIEKYMIDKDVPDEYKELSIKYSRQTLVNKICRDPQLYAYRRLLYKAVFQTKNRLTHDKLKHFQNYITLGYSLNANEISTLAYLNGVVDEKQAWLTYWNHLSRQRNETKEAKLSTSKISRGKKHIHKFKA